MSFLKFVSVFLILPVLLSSCATAPKKAVSASDPRDEEIARLKRQLEEKGVEKAEAEARAAKAENDLIEASSAKTAKPKDPYLK